MKLILDNELEVKVFLYDTEEERDKSIEQMKRLGFTAKRSGVANISTESTTTAYDDDNWKPYAEFMKVRERFQTKDNISYETGMYFFNICNPIER
ncbi:hypothetical protein ACR77J_07585 [Tissierella praeacuta]|uniref:hypothetical protein n=1 Tax=Tissierella praeacuta TaxID=43131 RepID=UPI003DA6AC0F